MKDCRLYISWVQIFAAIISVLYLLDLEFTLGWLLSEVFTRGTSVLSTELEGQDGCSAQVVPLGFKGRDRETLVRPGPAAGRFILIW